MTSQFNSGSITIISIVKLIICDPILFSIHSTVRVSKHCVLQLKKSYKINGFVLGILVTLNSDDSRLGRFFTICEELYQVRARPE